ncbi:rust resistance kinase Lr10-like [Typha angustifolia]|uniref:rust resistance kinase Lr10-like n=1 Tax=Typha angustifolia TaxID=59011 RepID=UPI003C2CB31E
MFKVLASILLFLFFCAGSKSTAFRNDDEDFFKNCPPSRCGGRGGPKIRYPFRLKSRPPICGAPGMELSCWGSDTVLVLPQLGTYNVTAIDYVNGGITIKLWDSWPRCPLQNLSSINLTTTVYQPRVNEEFSLLGCPREDNTSSGDDLIGPIECMSSANQLIYAVDSEADVSVLPSDCMVVSKGHIIPFGSPHYYEMTLRERVNDFMKYRDPILSWSVPPITHICQVCEAAGKDCGFRSASNQSFCRTDLRIHGSHVKLIAATSASALVLLLLLVIILLYLYTKSDKERETRLKVEKFLSTYTTTKPTRYTFSEVKKMTKRFKNKLGQGGFGSVYKGELLNGVPVAVKMLERSKGDGEEFINEVATIGRIHHVNVVRLLGFCSEGTTHALIYEFMSNESLEKYIFSRDSNGLRGALRMQKLQQIAFGIARGIEYLHQGCNQRILHFDIKPHNILLDYDLNPKISDFGLAKLCSRDQSIVTMTAARGTMGYIAPEMYSRNFGTVSYKSDVYSFGMLVLEMVGGKKNADPEIESQNQIYFPEWVYDQLINGQDLGLEIAMTESESEIAKKLAIVALWCIQWNPTERPSMTRVMQMLMGDLQSLQMPPKPFVSSIGHDSTRILNEV